AKSLKASFGNCEGWTGMLCALKVYIEHGINLRDGFYK
ncbi:MAG TPA: ATPase, partial [Devosia sp.]|nr:ATPase [Devosia sp.]